MSGGWVKDGLGGAIGFRFESMGEVIDAAGAECKLENDDRASRRDAQAKWSGTPTYEAAENLARHGYPDIRPEVDRLAADLVGSIAELIDDEFAYHFDVSGAEVDVALYLAGEPECMLETHLEPMPTRGRLVKLWVSVSANCQISPEQILHRGAAVVALTQLLAMAGNHIEIWVSLDNHSGKPWEGRDHHLSLQARIKAASDPLDIDAISFALAHPSFLRRILFSVLEHAATRVRQRFGLGLDTKKHGYGYPEDCRSREDIGPDVYLPMITRNDPAYDRSWIVDQLEACGVTVHEG